MGSAASCKAPSKYGHKTSSDVIMQDFGVYADGKHVIVTGSNSGLGFETARSLAKSGAIVTIACRSEQNGLEAVAKIKTEVVGAQVSFLPLDLASLSSVRTFAMEYKSLGKPLHFLVNNAGVMACPKTSTADGLEMQFGVNHIGHFLLTNELLDLLKSSGTVSNPSRVVTLSSYAPFVFAPSVGIRMDDLRGSNVRRQKNCPLITSNCENYL